MICNIYKKQKISGLARLNATSLQFKGFNKLTLFLIIRPPVLFDHPDKYVSRQLLSWRRSIQTVCCSSDTKIQRRGLQIFLNLYSGKYKAFLKALESGMCDVIKIRLKRRIATRNGKGNQPLNIKTDVERQILKLELTNFRWSFYFILLLVASLLFRRIFMTSHMTLSGAPSS